MCILGERKVGTGDRSPDGPVPPSRDILTYKRCSAGGASGVRGAVFFEVTVYLGCMVWKDVS